MTSRRGFLCAVLLGGGSLAMWPCSSAFGQTTPDLLTEVSRRLDNPAVLRGEFDQTKTLKGFKRPLLSHGRFVMARDRGIQWITSEPFASTLVVTRERLLTVSDGVSQQVDTRQEPGLRAVNDMLMALLAGDVKALAGRFQSEGALSGSQGWRLILIPRDTGLARFIARIELEGDRHVTHVRLFEASGDDSHIRFSRQTTTALSQAEAARFN
ncbi:MAG: outer membrane lipoprotein carrier protein LolA [Pseudomonadota bacterium]